MNAFNRIVITLLLLALIPIVTIALIVPGEAIDLLRDGLDQLDAELGSSVPAGRLVISVVLALVIDAMLVYLIYRQLRRPKLNTVSVRHVREGEAQIAVDSVTDRLKYHIDLLPGVLDVEPTVVGRRRGIQVTLDVEVAAEVNLPASVEEISARTRQVVEDEMGLKLQGKPKLNLRTVTLPAPLSSRPPKAETFSESWDAGVKQVEGKRDLSTVGKETFGGFGDESG